VAHLQRLRLCGAALLKCVLEGYAIGPELARFVYDYLLSEHRPLHISDDPRAPGAFSSAAESYRALADYAPLATSLWPLRQQAKRSALDFDAETYVDFGFLPADCRNDTVTLSSVADADAFISRCARYCLLECRRPALDALRDGFKLLLVGGEQELDVTPTLQLFAPSEAAALIGGRRSIDSASLIRLVQWPALPAAAKAWGSEAPSALLRQWMSQQTEDTCTKLFRCLTARAAIPDPRREPISIFLEPLKLESDDGAVASAGAAPFAATCSNTLCLPAYTSPEQLKKGMDELLAEGMRFTEA